MTSTSVVASKALHCSVRPAHRRLIMTCGGFMAWLSIGIVLHSPEVRPPGSCGRRSTVVPNPGLAYRQIGQFWSARRWLERASRGYLVLRCPKANLEPRAESKLFED